MVEGALAPTPKGEAVLSLACFEATHMLSAEQLPEVSEKLRPGAARNPPWERAGGCNHGKSEK